MTTARAYGGKRRRTAEELGYDPDAWSTPQWLFDELNAEFNFDLDAAASPDNAKCSTFFTRADDGLHTSWAHFGSTVFVNPPYSEVEKWIEKAAYEANTHDITVVMLVKADTSTQWWRNNYKKATEVRFRERIQFVPPPGYTRKVGSPNMGHAVLIFRGAK